ALQPCCNSTPTTPGTCGPNLVCTAPGSTGICIDITGVACTFDFDNFQRLEPGTSSSQTETPFFGSTVSNLIRAENFNTDFVWAGTTSPLGDYFIPQGATFT